MPPTSRRAAALAPDERRAMLVAATLPLVLERGADVSTRQIAEAAGVAEGTIFRVFDTKEELLRAALASAFDPSGLVDELRRIDAGATLEVRLAAAVELLQAHVRHVFHVLYALRGSRGPGDSPHPHGGRSRPDDAAPIVDALVDLIAPDAAQLRCSPHEAARRLHVVTFAGSHPMITQGQPMTPGEIVSLLLDGVRLPVAVLSIGGRSC